MAEAASGHYAVRGGRPRFAFELLHRRKRHNVPGQRPLNFRKGPRSGGTDWRVAVDLVGACREATSGMQ